MFIGKHVYADLVQCNPTLLTDKTYLEQVLWDAALAANATPLSKHTHDFGNGGLSCVIIVTESHISIHTWPEYCYAAVDIFTCDKQTNPEAALNHILDKLCAIGINIDIKERGAQIKKYGCTKCNNCVVIPN